MKIIYTLFFLCTVVTPHLQAQVDTTPAHYPNTPMHYNAGFDVIIKLNGEILYGLVKEVDPFYIKYKRTDIPDGPIYHIAKNEVYAISYRNQVKEIINPHFNRSLLPVEPLDPLFTDTLQMDDPYFIKKPPLIKRGTAHIGIGFIRSFSKVKNVSQYESEASFPTLIFAYDADYKNNVKLGLQMGFGNRKFSQQKFSSYDSTFNNINIKENVFALYGYARYAIATNSFRFKPYVLGGIGITSSSINSENQIKFTNNNSQELLVKSGGRTAGLGIIARIGTQYYINNQVRAFLDAGVGLSVLSIGISINTQ